MIFLRVYLCLDAIVIWLLWILELSNFTSLSTFVTTSAYVFAKRKMQHAPCSSWRCGYINLKWKAILVNYQTVPEKVTETFLELVSIFAFVEKTDRPTWNIMTNLSHFLITIKISVFKFYFNFKRNLYENLKRETDLIICNYISCIYV